MNVKPNNLKFILNLIALAVLEFLFLLPAQTVTFASQSQIANGRQHTVDLESVDTVPATENQVLVDSLMPMSSSFVRPCATPSTTTGGIVFTFDDNTVEQWHGIREMLAKYDVKATFFLNSYYRMSEANQRRVQELAADGHEIASHSRNHKNAATYCPPENPNCALSPKQRAKLYIKDQILPQLEVMASDGIFPRSFAYPYGIELPETTDLLLRYFGHVRNITRNGQFEDALVTCADGQFVIGMGFDYIANIPYSIFHNLMDEAMCYNENLILFGHHIHYKSTGYYVGEKRLERFIKAALLRGLTPRRMRDICSWQATSLDGPWNNIFDTPRPLSDVHIADFDGDGYADAFRTNGRTWELLRGSGKGFDTPSNDAHWEYWNTSTIELYQVDFGDFDGDGRTDIFWASEGLWRVSFGGNTPWKQINHSSFDQDRLRFADFDGDGTTDVFLVSSGRWRVSYSGLTGWREINNSIHDPEQFRFGDFDSDGRTDVFHARDGKWWVSYGGTKVWAKLNTSAFVPEQQSLVDIDGDGSTDIFRTDGVDWWVSYGGTTSWKHLRSSDLVLYDLAFANLDGEGPADILRVDNKLP